MAGIVFSASFTSLGNGTAFDISAQGFDDWGLWNLGSGSGTNVAPTTRKSGGGSLIGNLTCTVATLDGFAFLLRTVSWTGGTPTASGGTSNGVYNTLNSGGSFNDGADCIWTFPADTTLREATVYLGAFCSDVTVTATLSDGTSSVSNATMTNGQTDTDVSDGYLRIIYSAASAGQTLTVRAVSKANGAFGASADVEPWGAGLKNTATLTTNLVRAAQTAEATTQTATLVHPSSGNNVTASQTAAVTSQTATLAARATAAASQTAAATTQTSTLAARATAAAAQTAAVTTQTATLAARATLAGAQTAAATTQVATLNSGTMSFAASQTAAATTQVATLGAIDNIPGLAGSIRAYLRFNGTSGSTTSWTDDRGNTWAVVGSGPALANVVGDGWGRGVGTTGIAGKFVSSDSNYLASSNAGARGQFTGDFTVRARCYIPHTNALNSTLISLGNETTGRLSLHLQNSSLVYNVFGNGTLPSLGGTVPRNVWFDLVFCRQGTTLRGYIDGVQTGTQTLSGTVGNTGGFMVGRGSTSQDIYFDDLVVYDTCLYPNGTTFTPPIGPTGEVVQAAEPTTQVATLAAIATIPGSPNLAYDPLLSQVTNLLHFEGANGSNTFTDVKGVTWTAGGGATISTSGALNGSSAGSFTGGYIDAVASASFGFGTGAWEVEFGVAVSSTGLSKIIYDTRDTGATGNLVIGISTSGFLFAQINSTVYGNVGPAITTGTWRRGAISYDGTTIRGFVEGVQQWATAATLSLPTSAKCRIGNNYTGNNALGGLADEVRTTIGSARHTAAYTPNGQPFPDVGGLVQVAEATTQVATIVHGTATGTITAAQTADATTQTATLAARATIAAAQTAQATTQTATLAARATLAAAQTAEVTTQLATLARPAANTITAAQTAATTTQVTTLVARVVLQAAQQAEATTQAATVAVRAVLQAAQTAAATTQIAALARATLGLTADQLAQATAQAATISARASVQANQTALATTQAAALAALATLTAAQLAQATTQVARLAINFDFERTQRTLTWPDGDRLMVWHEEPPPDASERLLVLLDAYDRTLVLADGQDRNLIVPDGD